VDRRRKPPHERATRTAHRSRHNDVERVLHSIGSSDGWNDTAGLALAVSILLEDNRALERELAELSNQMRALTGYAGNLEARLEGILDQNELVDDWPDRIR
jgi:hypothetical protein